MALTERTFPEKHGYQGFFGADQSMAPETYYVRLRGLPFSAREEDVRTFLGIPVKNVTFTLTATGRASGECYVELNDTSAVKDALLLHKKEMGGRYIEVFSVSEQERLQMVRNGVLRGPGESDLQRPVKYVVRLRGLPFETNNDDIKEFFEGLDIEDIVIDLLAGGRPSGEAFVRFATKEHAEKALERNKSYMGSRYVEVFRSSWDEMENSYYESHGYPPARAGPIPLREAAAAFGPRNLPRPRPLIDFDEFYEQDMYPRRGPPVGPGPMGRDRAGFRSSPYGDPSFPPRRNRFEDDEFGPPPARRGGFRKSDDKLFMRGMPYSVTGVDIEMFFDPIRCMEIKLGYGPDGRPSGDAQVTFESVTDCDRALSRSGRMMKSRYVELFPEAEMPASARRIEFRSVSSSSSLLKLPNPSMQSNAAGYGRERGGRRPMPAGRTQPRSTFGNKMGSQTQDNVSTGLDGNIGEEPPVPAPVPKPVPLAQVNAASGVGSYSEGTGVGNGYGYGSFASTQPQQAQQQTAYSAPPQPSYTATQTPSSFPSQAAAYNAQSYGQTPSAYTAPTTYSAQAAYGNPASYSQPAYATTPYGAQTTYAAAPTTYTAQPYYSQSTAYGQAAAYATTPGYGQPAYTQVPYGTTDPTKPAW